MNILSIILSLLLVVPENALVERIALPEGDLHWTNVRPENVRFCVPAGFTDGDGKILHSYMLDGKEVKGTSVLRMKVSLKGHSFTISPRWESDEGFQQYTLVLAGKAMPFPKDSREYVRRALCKDGDEVFLLESKSPMTLADFARECALYATDAVYLDMGRFGWGYCDGRTLSSWAVFWRDRQTNWIYIR